MKISKRVREEAAVLCAGYASTPHAYSEWHSEDAPATLGACNKAERFAAAAFWTVARERGVFVCDLSTEDQLVLYAEAEALLHTGWSPS